MVKISTDSCVDINQDQKDQYHISVLPLIVILGDDEHFDGVDITPAEIFDYVRQTKQLPKTAARGAEDFKEYFADLLQDGAEVIHIGIGANLSSSYANAMLAKRELQCDRLTILDSQSLSTGIGLQVLKAARLAADGKSCQEICEALAHPERVQASFVVDSVDYLYKGGRCSAMSRFGANLLHIKPRLELQNGCILNTGKYLGNFKTVIKKYIDDMLTKYSNPETDLCFITHTCKDDIVPNEMVAYVKSKGIFKEVIASRAGATISCHCGENTLGILFINQE